MFARISRSWSLIKASASVLNADKELLVFPLLAALAAVVVVASFFLPAVGLGWLNEKSDEISPLLVMWGFFFYVTQYFVIIFFNTALVGAAMIRLDGGDPKVSDGMRIAFSKLRVILGYAVLAATVGLILRIIAEKVEFVGKFVAAMLGGAWTILTFLVVPVLVAQDVGPIDALKQSAQMLKKTWGENVVGQGGIGVVFALINVFLIVGFVVLGSAALASKSMALLLVVLALGVMALILSALIQSALSGIYSAMLYRYATGGNGAPGVDQELLRLAFAKA